MPELIRVNTVWQYLIAAELFREYAAWLGIDLSFQNFEKELHELDRMYSFPFGGIILSRNQKDFTGCVAIRRQQENVAELKRMYVRPAFQHKGTGTALLQEALLLASECGYRKVRLDTLSHMVSAISLYKKNGFKEIYPYYHNPEEAAVFFEKEL